MRVYGFSDAPYLLPTFLTPRVFSLELIRKRKHIKNELFIRFIKSLYINFIFKVRPFINKNKASLLIVEKLLMFLNFKKA